MRRMIIKRAQNGLSLPRRCCQVAASGLQVLLLLLLSLAALCVNTAGAATPPGTELTNIVHVSYSVGNGALIEKQAQVGITTSLRTPAQISFHTVFQGGETTPLPETYFADNANPGSRVWTLLNPGLPATVALSQTSSFAPGDTLLVRVEDFDQNIDPEQQETIIVQLETEGGDYETLRLTETRPDSGVFLGAVPSGQNTTGGHDGVLQVVSNVDITARYRDAEDSVDVATSAALIDPVSMVFDSSTGEPINGVRIKLVHDKSGQSARAYDTDGTTWPSEVVSGRQVAGRNADKYPPPADGEFRFPRVPAGEYRLEVVPPPGYRFPSQQSNNEIAKLGDIVTKVHAGSRGERFTLNKELEAVALNVPLDRFTGRFSVQKTVNQEVAALGDVLEYRITATNHDNQYPLNNVFLEDMLPPGFRYKAGSARFADGTLVPEKQVTPSGRLLSFKMGQLPPGEQWRLNYQAVVGAGSPRESATNTVQGFSDDAVSNVARAEVRLLDELMRHQGILLGRVFSGECEDPEQQQPVKDARIYLETGRSVVTDEQGRWHMAGVEPGTHVVQLDVLSIPEGMVLESCRVTARRAGQAYAEFVELDAGNMWRVDFRLRRDEAVKTTSDPEIAAKHTEKPDNPLLQFGDTYVKTAPPGLEILWPPEDYVPAISSIKIAVKHKPAHKLKVMLNDEPVGALNLEGSSTNKAKTVKVSRWTGVDINRKDNTLTAIVTDKSGREVGRLTRHVHFTERSVRARLVESESRLVADGRQRPVIAIRLEDEDGYTPRPRTHGYFALEYPHWKPVQPQVDKDKLSLDSPQQNGRYEYTVSNDGLVRIELEPTTRTGEVLLNIELSGGKTAPIRAWLQPAMRDWIMVGFAQGSVGYKTLSGNMQTLDDLEQEEGFYREGELSFFARGRVRGEYLLTIAYDSRKQRGEVGEQLDGVVDPERWYTLYGDDQQEQHETPSSGKLYLKLEKQQFSVLWGDYHTDLNVTELARYQRVLYGLKSAYQGDNISYTAFASQTSQRHQRDEILADGTSGLYFLSRKPLANSERVVLETRDRDHPEVVLESRALTRHSDYEIDYIDKSLFFKFPVSGTDDEFNPVLIVVDYESEDAAGDKELIAGGRIAYSSDDERFETGLSYLHEEGNGKKWVVDSKVRLTDDLSFSAEAGQSRADGGEEAQAWQAEAGYRRDKLQVRAYAREQEAGFGLGQQSAIGQGQRKLGAEGRYAFSEDSSVRADVSQQDNLDNNSQRTQGSITYTQQFENSSIDLGYRQVDEQDDAGQESTTQQVILGGSMTTDDGKTTVSARLEKGLAGDESGQALPDRARVGIDYKLTEQTQLFAEHELLRNGDEQARNSRLGMKTTPWDGAKLQGGFVREERVGADWSTRDYASLGLSQHWQVSEQLSVDASIDKVETLRQEDVVAGTAENTLLQSDDYLAASLGAAWSDEDWSATGRFEYRDGEQSDKQTLRLGAVRELDNQRSVGAQMRWLETQQDNGDSERETKLSMNIALRPENLQEDGTWFNRLDIIDEQQVQGGDKTETSKIINNLHYNRRLSENVEFSLHHGMKLTEQDSASGKHRSLFDTTQTAVRLDVDDAWDIGLQGGYLHGWEENNYEYYAGIAAGFAPTERVRIEVGYNFDGFEDEDFDSGNYTHQGPYIDFNFRLDQDLIKSLRK